jgi:predicted nucleotidyltransferase
MKPDLTSYVGGRPLLFTRDFLKRGLSFTVSSAARLLKEEDDGAVLNYLGALIDAGYLMRDAEASANGEPVYLPTRLGVSLRKTKNIKRIARPVAERHLAAVLSTIERVNHNPELLSWVEDVDVFGSFAEGADDVGDVDVDVAVLLSKRSLAKKWTDASYERAKGPGVHGSFIKMITWGEEEIWRELRKASRYLDLQPKDDVVTMGCPLTPVYRRKA